MVYEEGCYVLGPLIISNHFGSFSFTIPIAMTTVNIKPLMTGPEGSSEFCFPRIRNSNDTRHFLTHQQNII